MKPLWRREDLLAALNGEAVGALADCFTGISIDSRSVEKGDIFFAIKGEQLDGHDYALKAHQNGASLLIVDKNHKDAMVATGAPLVIVDDVLLALERLAKAARQRSRARIIAITGSVGKTTTKEALRHALQGQGNIHANPASFNNQWGVPLTLARMPEDTDFGIFEIGMNHSGEIRHLVKMVVPHIAIITRIAAAHFGFFNSVEEIAAAKAEIFETMAEDSIVLLNHDDEYFDFLQNKARQCGVKTIYSFGECKESRYRLLDVKLLPECSCLKMLINDQEAMIKIGAPGRHVVQNCLAVIGVCDCLHVDLAMVSIALASFSAERGRGERHQLTLPTGGSFILIDESYNANPTSMRAALELLSTTETIGRGRRIAVLGDMLELGETTETAHRELAEPIRAANVQYLFLLGPAMKTLKHVMEDKVTTLWRINVDELLPLVVGEVRAGDVLMVKSSNSCHSSRIVAALLERYKPLAA